LKTLSEDTERSKKETDLSLWGDLAKSIQDEDARLKTEYKVEPIDQAEETLILWWI